MTQPVCYKTCQVEAFAQEPLSKISFTESPANPAFDVKAERVECPLKILVSIPASEDILNPSRYCRTDHRIMRFNKT